MKFTRDWLKEHLKTNKSEAQIIEKLNHTGLEVEKVEPVENELSYFIIVDNNNFKFFGNAQDHKRVYEKDKGPTTVNQLTDNPVDDLIPLDSRELS